ncbi:esterase/lipase family protein [Nocardioides deserti]|uniref:Alpha/beta fold hydrolase n=1 Tax=Nocardioides deserti TaxID=1588644 RepID=A0ABR6U7N2_9ACTN|nr:alpha/beta fold hydrolase [Nocardioides deserti]MBC2960442.1 alpha/beta fold hydrolase [Nocardioides deserti]GGO71373.1 lipase [Nocardioides deserti]
MLSRLLAPLVAGVLGTLLALAPVPTSASTPVLDPDPPGANDWSCRPSAKHPTPVVLVHGTFGDRSYGWERMSSALTSAGWCVWSLEYGQQGTQDVTVSARELRAYVRRVRKATGAAKVSLVGHSQGGLLARYYVARLGGGKVVDDVVSIAATHHGSRFPLVGSAISCPACRQQAAGSAFLADLNAGDETPGRVSWTQVTTRYEQVVLPHTSGHLAPGPRTTNVTVQDLCALDLSEHLLLPSSSTTIAVTLDALGRRGPARTTGLGC